MKPAFTGSSAERALACPASQALPWATDKSSEPAKRGTAIHTFLAAVGQLGIRGALTQVPGEYRDICERLDLSRLPLDSTQFAAEVAFAWDISGKARVLGHDIGRDYGSITETEIPLTVDVVGVADDHVVVVDYKTGHGEVTPARDNPQLQLGALAAARAYNKKSAVVLLIYVREDRPAFIDRAEFDEWQLEDFSERFAVGAVAVARARYQVSKGETPDVNLGSHCRYCQVANCPGRQALIRSVVSDPAHWQRDITDALTPENAAEAYERLQQVRDAIASVTRAIHAYAEHNPIDLGDGRWFGPQTSKRESVDGEAVYETMLGMYGQKVADMAVSRDSTKKAIKEALRHRANLVGESLASVERAYFEVLRARGGVQESVSTSCKEYRKK